MCILVWIYFTTIYLTIIHKIHKSQILRQKLQDDPRYEMSVTEWFQYQAAEFYDTLKTIQKVPRCDKCLNSGGE